jgi:hypothetical protein
VEMRKIPMTFSPDKIMYSEEEVYDILVEHTIELFKKESKTLNEWFEQFKKK